MTSKSINVVGSHEILQRLGGKISRQRLYQITGDDSFPRPVATLVQGKVWLADDIERWISENRPNAGGSSPPSPPT